MHLHGREQIIGLLYPDCCQLWSPPCQKILDTHHTIQLPQERSEHTDHVTEGRHTELMQHSLCHLLKPHIPKYTVSKQLTQTETKTPT